MNYFNQSLTSIHKQLVNKDISVEELTKQTLDNIKAVDGDINAFLTLDEEGALKQANKLDEKGIDSDNLLSGMPVAVKDNIVTKGLKTTAASKILENFTPIYDATAAEKIKNLGTITVGKTNMDEFAMGGSTENSAFKITHNPWDKTKVPGGSSGGSAAAVAAGEVIAALGSDTGGSIRQPASFNGVVGMKPTYGRVSRWGLIAFGSSLDQIGPITRNVSDNATLLNAIAGHDDHDLTSSTKEVPDFTSALNKGVKGLRIGIPSEFMSQGLDEDVKKVVNDTAETFKKLGATVGEVSLPHTKYGVAAYYIISSSEASSNLQRFDGIRYGRRAKDVKNLDDLYIKSRSEGFGDEVKRRIMLGTFSLSAGFYDAYFKKAAQVRTLMINDFTNVFKDYDLILAPTAPTPAYGIGEDVSDPMTMYMNDVLTLPVNLAGLPGMSIPAGFSKGLPVGVQLIGRPYDELTVYQAGSAFEKDTDFAKQTPKMGGNN
ncbi:Asp-tRNA(Asn)/Glu-tRNA(Gln) amidotransferase subunit GatA [Lentilactobacillus hilgardii]|uniref:Asp-tRNA(Asn)/Glu-tRNA(Gln) amidotransferase subunit GatA n=1 Tax=Lentilactobacillus hilgardii TaxID=1588 RepID=UPI00390C809F